METPVFWENGGRCPLFECYAFTPRITIASIDSGPWGSTNKEVVHCFGVARDNVATSAQSHNSDFIESYLLVTWWGKLNLAYLFPAQAHIPAKCRCRRLASFVRSFTALYQSRAKLRSGLMLCIVWCRSLVSYILLRNLMVILYLSWFEPNPANYRLSLLEQPDKPLIQPHCEVWSEKFIWSCFLGRLLLPLEGFVLAWYIHLSMLSICFICFFL